MIRFLEYAFYFILSLLLIGCANTPQASHSGVATLPDSVGWEPPSDPKLVITPLPHHVSITAASSGDGQVVTLETNASNHPNSQAEVSIAANPDDPDHVVAATMSLDNQLMILNSRDGGLSWRQVRLPLLGGATNHADPMLAFDANGDIYLTLISVFNGNQVLGIEATVSRDGGDSWETPSRLSSNSRDDKTAMAADRHPDSPYFGNVYVAWKLTTRGIRVSTRTPATGQFSLPVAFSTDSITGLDLAVGDDGTVYLSAYNSTRGSITVWRSSDGGLSFGPANHVRSVHAQAYTRTPSVCTRKALVHSSIAVNRSQVTDNERLYVTWNDYAVDSTQACDNGCTCNSDIFLSTSDDQGTSWSAAVAVGQTAQAGDQYHAWLDVDERGTVLVAYKDTREDTDRRKTHTYLSYSMDGGETWEPDVRVSSASGTSTSSFQYGDYQGLSVSSDRIYTAWADFRDSPTRSNIYVARTTLGLPGDFAIDFGVSGAWFEPATTGQGFFLEAIPADQALLLAWFTFSPPAVGAKLGETNHRWLTAQGTYDGNVATLDLTNTSGGDFDAETPVNNSPPGSVGSVQIEFHSCASATLTYDLFEENLSGVIELVRASSNDDCEGP